MNMFKTGQDAQKLREQYMRQQAAEAERKKANSLSLDFRELFAVKNNSQALVVFLDKSWNDMPTVYINEIQKGQDFKTKLTLVSSKSVDPDGCDVMAELAKAEGYTVRSTLVYVASVLTTWQQVKDGKPQLDANGKPVIGHGRKYFLVRPTAYESWNRWLSDAERTFGTLRGVYAYVERGGDQFSSSLGTPQVKNNTVFRKLSEADLLQRFGHDEIKAKDGTVIIPKNGKLQPYNYNKTLVIPTEQQARELLGLEPPVGSVASQANLHDLDDLMPSNTVGSYQANVSTNPVNDVSQEVDDILGDCTYDGGGSHILPDQAQDDMSTLYSAVQSQRDDIDDELSGLPV